MLTRTGLIDFVDRLNNETSTAGSWTRAADFFAGQGLPWLCYGYIETNDDETLDVPRLRSNVPPAFLKRWEDEKLCGVDPAVRHSSCSLQCAVFGSEFLKREGCDPIVWSYYRDLREIGSCSLLTVPFRGIPQRASGFMDIGGAFEAGDMSRYLNECQDMLVLAAHYTDQRLAVLDRKEEARGIGLTSREIQCLQWLATGLRNDRIAERAGISVATVRFHLNNARLKLNSTTREQAVARAVAMGLIEP
jgi:LuxR family transcriptional activator of bioluminescence operon